MDDFFLIEQKYNCLYVFSVVIIINIDDTFIEDFCMCVCVWKKGGGLFFVTI